MLAGMLRLIRLAETARHYVGHRGLRAASRALLFRTVGGTRTWYVVVGSPAQWIGTPVGRPEYEFRLAIPVCSAWRG